MGSRFIHEAQLQETTDGKVRCLTCERCGELADGGGVGWCRTRQDRDGTLYTLAYGLAASPSCHPVEKKPLYHFTPGPAALTAGPYSCNFDCPWFRNPHFSKAASGPGRYTSPQDLVSQASKLGGEGTSMRKLYRYYGDDTSRMTRRFCNASRTGENSRDR